MNKGKTFRFALRGTKVAATAAVAGGNQGIAVDIPKRVFPGEKRWWRHVKDLLSEGLKVRNVPPERIYRQFYGKDYDKALSLARAYLKTLREKTSLPIKFPLPAYQRINWPFSQWSGHPLLKTKSLLAAYFRPLSGLLLGDPTHPVYNPYIHGVILKTSEFFKLPPAQRLATLLHEYGHALAHFNLEEEYEVDQDLIKQVQNSIQSDPHFEALKRALPGVERKDYWSYLLDPTEFVQRVADLKRAYYKVTGKIITTPEEMRRAWRYLYRNRLKYIQGPYGYNPLLFLNPDTPNQKVQELIQAAIQVAPAFVMRPQTTQKAAATEYAPGIPEKGRLGDIGELEKLVGELTDIFIQRHAARRAGPHFDLRIKGPSGLYSFALPKGELPRPGEKRLAIQTELHTPEYAGFEGTIPEGVYGAGTVQLAGFGKVLITKVKRDAGGHVKQIDFTYDTGAQPVERFILVRRPKERQWLLINVTPTESPDYEKRHFNVVSEKELDKYLEQVSPEKPMSVKIDGALGLVRFLKDKAEILSYRTSKRTGGPIVHTERVAPKLLTGIKVPPELVGRTFEAEIYAETPEGKVLPPQTLGGILNAALAKSLQKQKELGAKMRVALWGVVDKLPQEERKRLIERAVSIAPDVFTVPPEATSPQEARKLLQQVISGKLPLSREGVVFSRAEEPPAKYKKTTGERDVIIHSFTPGKGRLAGKGIGAIRYVLYPGQKEPVGEVGTGLSDELRRELYEHPEQYIGRVAVIEAQEQYPSGAFRAPRLLKIHPDYPRQRGRKLEWSPEIEQRLRETRRKSRP